LRIRRSPPGPEPRILTVGIVLSRDEWPFYEMAPHGTNDGPAVRVRQKIRRHLQDIAEYGLEESSVVALDADEARVLVQQGVAYARAVMRSESG
jgi:hypothetical protein